MAIPDFQTLMRPILEVQTDGGPHSQADVRNLVAAKLGVTDAERKELLPSGKQPVFSNRVAWATTHLAQAGLLYRPARAMSQITDRGREVLRDHSDRVDLRVLAAFPEYAEFRKRTREPGGQPSGALAGTDLALASASPDETIKDIIDTAHSAVAAELLSRILMQPPEFLEHLVLDLLDKMGYGGLTEHLGGPGDGGLDGLIRLDRLGLDIVYVQAKRYTEKVVGRPDVQAFVGALQGAQATRGIFITTSRFSNDATVFADRVNLRLVLIDGPELASLMIEHNCGVVAEHTFTLKHVDENYFDDE
jgi:restriction system protein